MTSKNKKQIVLHIEEILHKLDSPLVQYLRSVNDIKELPHDIRKQIANKLGDELCSKGFNDDYEPNEYGLKIEDMIDYCIKEET
jgi:hypothetical protein